MVPLICPAKNKPPIWRVSKLLFKNGYNKETLDFVRKGIEFNEGNVRLWYFLYQIPESTQSEKDMAVARLKLLDPNFTIK